MKKLSILFALVFFASTLPGCLGMVEGMRSRRLLAEEHEYLRDEETGILKGAEPFRIDGADTRKAVLLIHGFSGTPYDMRGLGEHLAAHGYTVYAPLLKGNGTSARDLAATGWRDWLESAETAYGELSAKYETVYVVGHSMGGDLAINLAAEHETAGVVLLAPCIFYKGGYGPIPKEFAVRWLTYFMATDYIVKEMRNQTCEPAAADGRPTYRLYPITALRSFDELMGRTRAALPGVSEPVLVIQSMDDDLVSDDGPAYVLEHVSSTDRRAVWVDCAKHLVTLDGSKDEVYRETLEFVEGH
ncbi:MAG: alpha/beta fold hydrolase [Nitrospirae bacterium]|nr:alpha/beta fold hydrolase [Nitrospirota bacterium]